MLSKAIFCGLILLYHSCSGALSGAVSPIDRIHRLIDDFERSRDDSFSFHYTRNINDDIASVIHSSKTKMRPLPLMQRPGEDLLINRLLILYLGGAVPLETIHLVISAGASPLDTDRSGESAVSLLLRRGAIIIPYTFTARTIALLDYLVGPLPSRGDFDRIFASGRIRGEVIRFLSTSVGLQFLYDFCLGMPDIKDSIYLLELCKTTPTAILKNGITLFAAFLKKEKIENVRALIKHYPASLFDKMNLQNDSLMEFLAYNFKDFIIELDPRGIMIDRRPFVDRLLDRPRAVVETASPKSNKFVADLIRFLFLDFHTFLEDDAKRFAVTLPDAGRIEISHKNVHEILADLGRSLFHDQDAFKYPLPFSAQTPQFIQFTVTKYGKKRQRTPHDELVHDRHAGRRGPAAATGAGALAWDDVLSDSSDDASGLESPASAGEKAPFDAAHPGAALVRPARLGKYLSGSSESSPEHKSDSDEDRAALMRERHAGRRGPDAVDTTAAGVPLKDFIDDEEVDSDFE